MTTVCNKNTIQQNDRTNPIPNVYTFGCRLNTVESEIIRTQASAANIQDVVIINTCAVTEEAVRQAKQAIRRAKRNQPGSPIIVTGCAAQIYPQEFTKMREVSLVIGNNIKLHPSTWERLAEYTHHNESIQDTLQTEKIENENIIQNKLVWSDVFSCRSDKNYLINGIEGRAKAFIQIQNGCDHRCTFCVIPYGRGPSRSIPTHYILKQVSHLVEIGFNEVVLSGVDITSWGSDLPGTPKLGQLLTDILKHVSKLPRLRISSVDSIELDSETIELIGREHRIMPYLHLSLQSGDDMILKRMKRRHSRADVIDFCNKIRALREDIALGADLIAGFPTETEEMFDNSITLIQECELSFLHVFPFSPHSQTPAARMPQLDRHIVKERAARLRSVGRSTATARLNKEIGKSRNILIEQNNQGRTEHFIKARISNTGHIYKCGEIVTAKICEHDCKELKCTA